MMNTLRWIAIALELELKNEKKKYVIFILQETLCLFVMYGTHFLLKIEFKKKTQQQ